MQGILSERVAMMVANYGYVFVEAIEELWNQSTMEQLKDMDYVIKKMIEYINNSLQGKHKQNLEVTNLDEIKEHIQDGIKHAVKNSAQSTANAAFITEEQRQVLVRKQEEFLGLKGKKLTEEFVQRQLGYAAVEVHQAHLKQLKTIYQPINRTSDFFAEQRIRFCRNELQKQGIVQRRFIRKFRYRILH